MSIETKKYQLIHQLLKVNDEKLIDIIKFLLELSLNQRTNNDEVEKDFWDDLTKKQRKRIDASLEQMEKGIGLEHDVVMAEFKAKIK